MDEIKSLPVGTRLAGKNGTGWTIDGAYPADHLDWPGEVRVIDVRKKLEPAADDYNRLATPADAHLWGGRSDPRKTRCYKGSRLRHHNRR